MMRKTIARRLTESKQNVPHFYLTIDVDAAPISRLREQINDDLTASTPRSGPETTALKVSFNDLSSRPAPSPSSACPSATRPSPPKRSSSTSASTSRSRWPIPDGLVTPVIRDADKKSIVAIAQEVRELAGKAKAKKLAPKRWPTARSASPTWGCSASTTSPRSSTRPRAPSSRSGKFADEPVVWEGAVVPGQRLAMTLSCDHRVVDGAVGATFLAELRGLIERPTQMLVF